MTPRLIDSLYTEAMLLADEARSYFDRGGRDDRLELDPLLRVGFSIESLKVTTRLMHIIAWLLTQRAIETGEIARSEPGRTERQLGDAPTSDPDAIARLPESALQLIRASQELFARVGRIDQSSGQLEPQPNPARSLLNRLERAF
jgi:regulator of CtrA degradation